MFNHKCCNPKYIRSLNNITVTLKPTDDEMLKVLQNQNAITELLVKQQRQSQLPTKDIPVFKGDALQYKSFIRTFEHSIEQKTDNEKDKLYFLEQFTAEEPQELVRSCAHMSASKGYSKAKKLL